MSQIPHIPQLSPALHRNARQAIQLMNRFPVNELDGSQLDDVDDADDAAKDLIS
jgi:hypothetical protein